MSEFSKSKINKTGKNTDEARKNTSLHRNIAPKIFCIFAAFCFWVYVMLVESPEYEQTFSLVPVNLINTDVLTEKNGLMIYSGYGNMVGVTLAGKKSVLSKIDADDLVVTADVSTISGESGRHPCEINVDVPSGCKLVNLSQETITVYVDVASYISVPIKVSYDNISLPSEYLMEAIELPFDSVTVEGPANMLNRVVGATHDADLSGIGASTTITREIYLIDEFGERIDSPYIKFSPQNITLDINIKKKVTVPIEIDFRMDFFDFTNTNTVVNPVTVTAKGDPSVIDGGNLIEKIVIDEKYDYTDMGDGRLTLDATYTLKAADGVELDRSTVSVYSVTNESLRIRNITIPGKNVVDTGGQNGVEYTWDRDEPVTVKLIGSMEAITSIDAEDITLEFDMSGYSENNSGSKEISARVIIDSVYKNEILALGAYEVTVTFIN